MKKVNKYHPTNSKLFHNKIVRLGVLIIVFVCVYAISMYIPLIGGFTAYPVAIVRCGKLPIITSDFMGVYNYTEPGMKYYYGATALNTMKDYVCTTRDAEKQGYHRAL